MVVLVAVGDVVDAVVAAVEGVWVVWEVEVVVAPPNVCLESMRRKTDGGGRRKREKCLQYLCYSLAKGISGDLLDNGVACPRWGFNGKGGEMG